MEWLGLLWLILSIIHLVFYIFSEEHDLTQLALSIAWMAMFRTSELGREK